MEEIGNWIDTGDYMGNRTRYRPVCKKEEILQLRIGSNSLFKQLIFRKFRACKLRGGGR
jgi:hypothetical protein